MLLLTLCPSVPLRSLLPILPARTCDEWVSQYNNGVLSGEDFSAVYDCTGKSNAVRRAIDDIVGIGCCGGNSGEAKSTCWKERAFICKDPRNYEPLKQISPWGDQMTCDSVVDQVNHVNNGVLANLTDQDFSAAYDCGGKSNDVIMLINYVAGAGCCEGNIDINKAQAGASTSSSTSSAAKSACWKDRSNICEISTDYEPFKQVSGLVTGGNTVSCDTVVEMINNGALAAQDFSVAYTCNGKSTEILSGMENVAGLGCCGASGIDACAPVASVPSPAVVSVPSVAPAPQKAPAPKESSFELELNGAVRGSASVAGLIAFSAVVSSLVFIYR